LPVKFYNGAETDSLLTPVEKEFLKNKNFIKALNNQKTDIIISPLVKKVDLNEAYSNFKRLDITIRIDVGFTKFVAGIHEEKIISKVMDIKADEQKIARKMILDTMENMSRKLFSRLMARLSGFN
jgi:hypothetical protein